MTTSLPVALTSPLTKAQETSVINLVRRTARTEIMPLFQNHGVQDVTQKSGRFDLVTQADLAAEAMLRRGLQQMFPHALIVGEESASEHPDIRTQIAEAEFCILLDPLDGTWNFSNDLPLFGVILSVTRFGAPIFGLLYDPVRDDWISASTGNGAHKVRQAGTPRPLRMGSEENPKNMSGFIHLHLMPQNVQQALAPHLPQFARTQVLNCSCHEYRTLAQGGADFCLSAMMTPWDHAAGIIACQEAGGVARMLDGAGYNAGTPQGFLLTANNEAAWSAVHETFAFLLEL
ncbi:inositol monophosphatase [Roseovarius sp. EL26]|uniref:inositol monophosphatase family protein n=1 Tax=Roseovarius sp. EL26 TaxID=2126672 RepID=UPI000EA2EC2A|nr:inositol monophosphatase [Roseovarius sp. EL26]